MKTLLILTLLAVSLAAHALPRTGGAYTLSPETGSLIPQRFGLALPGSPAMLASA